MGVDSAGYSTSALFQAKDYNPNALATGLQSAATYDPTQQSTSQPTSSARYLTQTNSANVLPQDTASTTQNLQSQPVTAATKGLTAQNNNVSFPSYRSNLVTATSALPVSNNVAASAANTGSTQTSGGYTVSTGNGGQAATANPTAVNVTGTNSASIGTQALNYSGPSIINVGSNYYQFNPATGTYQYVGYRMSTGNGTFSAVGNLTPTQVASSMNLSGLDPKNMMNQVQQAIAIGQNSAIAGNLAAYQKDLASAKAQNSATQIATAGTTQHDNTLNYLTTHGGQLSAADQQLASMSFAGNTGLASAQQAAIQQAISDYAAQQAHASTLASLGNATVDTSASDATDAAAQRSLASQQASMNYGADAGFVSRFGNFDAAALAGQHQLNHEKAAATSYNNNLSNLATMLSTQYGYDKDATGNQLYADIQGVQQVAQQLQQELGQLSTSAGQKAQGQLNQLSNLIQQYQQAVASYGQNSAQAMQIATGLLGAAGNALGGLTT